MLSGFYLNGQFNKPYEISEDPVIRNIPAFVFAVVGSALALSPARAADLEPVPASGEWTFTIAPYLWAAGLSGDIGLFGREPVEVDMSFSDILDDLKFAGMVVSEAHNGSFGVFTDISYVKTKADESIRRDVLGVPAELSASVETDSFAATLMGEFRIVDEENMSLDVMAGGRLWSVSNDISAQLQAGGAELAEFSGDDGDTWVDPMVGAKTRIDTGSPLYFTAWGMIGGFGVSSDLAWDVMGGVGYQWSDWFSTVAGYRALGVDYENDGFVYDVVQQGFFLGGVMRF